MKTTQRPILFSTSMVQAILDRNKTQTRQVINRLSEFGKISEFGRSDIPGHEWMFRDKRMLENHIQAKLLFKCCPYGKPGDLLWVREAFCNILGKIHYKADDDSREFDAMGIIPKWKPSIHMLKEFTRIWLKVKDIRVEKLKNITQGDVINEGVHSYIPYYDGENTTGNGAVNAFANLWNSINEKRGHGWNLNPWVWIVEFEQVEKPTID